VSNKYLSDYSFFVFLRKSYISLRLVIKLFTAMVTKHVLLVLKDFHELQ